MQLQTIRIDEITFKELYQLHWERVFAVCYNNLQDVEVAKGMVQEIFKSLWERRQELEITVSVERYLLRAAKLKVFEHLRNTKVRREHIQHIRMLECGSAHCTENDVMYNSLKEKVSGLVDTLPNQCRKVFKLSREQGLSNREISQSLLISERAVEYHITRALSTLKANLTEYLA
ncbi:MULTISPECIES: RNA polymerase sigma-70 factor [Dyadobacter]|uniref:RNA polymerase sigma-70 factor n=1 Tax=Dyadobacter chenhuakuii TaxID=2909339 RepID=A0ABY4XQU7_9BACT|nr:MULTISPECIES: RNA polymerase sigma-70 factor [Dyadobacter]MCF2492922.1 RNA polymerase sigma-70 factor [Dyadobacter chenhuakuii]MCF2517700.1 RNA polymerase sigma-70 factor [Dyadobacter sp. CY351]USJ32788.1 RNA polymerase sigma-70 factor [Dyadobacter chenhuakuii]